jgi:hypothetical protein
MNAANEITRRFRAFKRRDTVPISQARINVRLEVTTPFPIQIKHARKTVGATQLNKPMLPSLSHMASPNDDFDASDHSQSATPLEPTPFLDLMLHPDKLAAALKIAEKENDAFDAALRLSRNSVKGTTDRTTPESLPTDA